MVNIHTVTMNPMKSAQVNTISQPTFKPIGKISCGIRVDCAIRFARSNGNSRFRELAFGTALALLLIVTGCGGGGGGGDGNTSSPPPPPPSANQSPTADAGSDQSVDEGAAVNLTGTGADTDGSITSFSWQQVGGAEVVISSANTANASFIAPMVSSLEVLEFRLIVTDNDDAVGSDTVSITVNDVAPPSPSLSVDLGNAIVMNEVDSVQLIAITSGVDVSLLTFEWSQIAGTPVDLLNASESAVNFVAPNVTEDTVIVLSVTVTANDGQTASDTIEITIGNYDQSFDDTTPRMIATGGTNVDLQALKTLSGTYQGLGASFEWTQLSGPAVNLLGTSSESARFTAPVVPGETTLVFRLVAEYQNNITMSDTIPISIVPKTVEKVLSALADFTDVDPAQRPFTREDIVNLLDQNADSLKTFISQSSRNLLRVDFDILDWITVDKNTTDYLLGGEGVVSDVINAMSNFADLGQYDKVLLLIFPLEQGSPGCAAFLVPTEWNTINGNFVLGTAWLSGFDMGCVVKGRLAHEFGHTFGFLHSFGLDCAKEPPIPISTIDPTDMNDSCLYYGLPHGSTDPETLFPLDAAIIANSDLDMMGGDLTQRYENLFPLHYQAIWQALAGWLPESQVLVPDHSGEYWLTTLESLTPIPKAMRISLGDDHELSPQYYWLQTREFSSCEVDVRLQASHIFIAPDQLDPAQVEKFQDGQAHSYFASYHDLIKLEGEAVQRLDVDAKVLLDQPFWDPYRGIHIAMLGCEEGDLDNAVRLGVNFSPLTIDPRSLLL